jgi:hypothetical protein
MKFLYSPTTTFITSSRMEQVTTMLQLVRIFCLTTILGLSRHLKLGEDGPQFKYEETLGGALSVNF